MFLGKTLTVFSALIFSACTSSSERATATIPPSTSSDSAYNSVLKKWQREAQAYDEFRLQIDVKAVLFTDEFRRAFLERWQRIRGESRSSLQEMTSGKSGALVSLYTPIYEYMTLDNAKLWSFELRFGDRVFAPTLVKLVPDKVMLQPYFPFVSNWSREYLVIFDTAAPGGESLVLPDSVTLALRSALSNIEFKWE